MNFPVDGVVPDLKAALSHHLAAVLVAEPGAGKTTRVPLALRDSAWLKDRKIVMLEPRRLAARASARRMAETLGEAVGESVGYTVRLERKVSAKTRIEVVTEGILTRRLQQDPELADTGLIIFDEFHERSLDGDFGLALVLDVQRVLRELGMTVLAVTHDRQEAFTLADRVAVLREGRLAQVGTPDELWNDPADTYVARLVGLSVLGGRAFRPEDIHATPDGSWDAVVTGRTFRDGHHLITARVDEESVVFVSQVPLETGDEIRLAAD